MARKYAQLDIVLRWNNRENGFDVSLVFDHPEDTQDRQEFVPELIKIDIEKLNETLSDPKEYGKTLSRMLFAPDLVQRTTDRAIDAAESMPVHLRLTVDAHAPSPYQAIRWETLWDQRQSRPLTTRENVLFSRYLSSYDWRDVGTLAKNTTLRVVVAVANPSDLEDHAPLGSSDAPLSSLEVERVKEQARKALRGMEISFLPDGERHTTLAEIIAELRKGVDILYLVCHGGFTEQPMLYLEDDDGAVDQVSGELLAGRIADLEKLPTIAVLCSCQSAGAGSASNLSRSSLAAVGPLLAQTGIAAVIAMQGNIAIDTTSTFFGEFFKELSQHGLPDRAMAVARGAIKTRQDWWMPVLFSRLKRGRAWYLPRFGGRERALFDHLRLLITDPDIKKCTPVLGSGVAAEVLLPLREDVASDFVSRRQLPLVKSSQRDLAKVAQYLSVDGGQDIPSAALRNYLRARLRKDFYSKRPDLDWENGSLQFLISELGKAERERLGKDDPYAMLAALPFPVYVTTAWSNLLEDALKAAGRPPVVRFFDWEADRDSENDIFDTDLAHPLVYHLFGTLSNEPSLVLTEDDYFAWLRAWTKRVDNDKAIPHSVKSSLTTGSLLFLGYSLDDWEFRVLFQSIKAFEASSFGKRFHVGVQIKPDTITIERDAAQDYLESYFGKDQVKIYWESCSDFLRELMEATTHGNY